MARGDGYNACCPHHAAGANPAEACGDYGTPGIFKTPHWQQVWPSFSAALRNKLQRGFEAYGDESFDLTPVQLLKHLQEEAIDLAGWGLILWARLQKEIEKHE